MSRVIRYYSSKGYYMAINHNGIRFKTIKGLKDYFSSEIMFENIYVKVDKK